MIAVKFRSHRLAVRTLAFHVGNRGSSPLGITIYSLQSLRVCSQRDTKAFFFLPVPVFLWSSRMPEHIVCAFFHSVDYTRAVSFFWPFSRRPPCFNECMLFPVLSGKFQEHYFSLPLRVSSNLYRDSTRRNRGLAVAVDLNLCYKDGTCAKSI